jgi:hypothetical protein
LTIDASLHLLTTPYKISKNPSKYRLFLEKCPHQQIPCPFSLMTRDEPAEDALLGQKHL